MKPTIVLSYSHKDADWRDIITNALSQLSKVHQTIEIWDDRQIEGGDDWYLEIEQKLRTAKVAILIVTLDFLGSTFCSLEEVPVLLQRMLRGQLRIVPFLAKDCTWELETWLAQLQLFPKLNGQLVPAEALTKAQLSTALKELVLLINKSVEDSQQELYLPELPISEYDYAQLPGKDCVVFGRSSELSKLDQEWDNRDCRIVVLYGPAGTGKSTLLRVWAEIQHKSGFKSANHVFAWRFSGQDHADTHLAGRSSTSADLFILKTLKRLGENRPDLGDFMDKAKRLSSLIRKRNFLLFLDGLEVVQRDNGEDEGRIWHPAIRFFLEDLADNTSGFCIITSRKRITGMETYESLSHLSQYAVDQLSRDAGRALLRSTGVSGSKEKLENACEEFGLRAATISWLGGFLSTTSTKRVERVSDIRSDIDSPDSVNLSSWRVLDAWLSRLNGSLSYDLLHLVAISYLPLSKQDLYVLLCNTPFNSNFTRQKNAEEQVSRCIEELTNVKLLTSVDDGFFDTHPLVREFILFKMANERPDSLKILHRTIADHQRAKIPEYVTDVSELSYVSSAIKHSVLAGNVQWALDKLYYEKIQKKEDNLSTLSLGAPDLILDALYPFFTDNWCPKSDIRVDDQAYLLGELSLLQRKVGQTRSAINAGRKSFRLYLSIHHALGIDTWRQMVNQIHTVVTAQVLTGKLKDALAEIKEFRKTYVEERREHNMLGEIFAIIGWVQAEQGSFTRALQWFQKAEEAHRKVYRQDQFAGTLSCHYAELLLETDRIGGVKKRLKVLVEHHECRAERVPEAFARSLCAKARWYPSNRLDRIESRHVLEDYEEALSCAREAGDLEVVIRVLLSRSGFFLSESITGVETDVDADLRELSRLISGCDMGLFEVDLCLLKGEKLLADGDQQGAKEILSQARDMMKAMGYLRRVRNVKQLEMRLRNS